MPAKSGFAARLAYVRWLRNRGRLANETDKELAAALGVTYGWLTKWKIRNDAPPGRDEARAIIAALSPLGVTEDWLFEGQGTPPEASLWKIWLKGPTAPVGDLIPDPRQTGRASKRAHG